ncbi:xyloglucan endotransglucosylase/hydrolase protein 9 [Corchorus olitorius]|uniref:Xyloglucan endotransglucosylase/hydrolase protein 9 n=1 Tax=Corchorus olitorius TaxID=93759 RepID=A0A1R3JLX8_9ROSI|nr:xyloglucan endotransglucosylase/hydrolase protein 9 [Corchorus olitorius]
MHRFISSKPPLSIPLARSLKDFSKSFLKSSLLLHIIKFQASEPTVEWSSSPRKFQPSLECLVPFLLPLFNESSLRNLANRHVFWSASMAVLFKMPVVLGLFVGLMVLDLASSAKFDELFQSDWASDHFIFEGEHLNLKLDNSSGKY